MRRPIDRQCLDVWVTNQMRHDGFGSLDIDAYGSATLRLLSNFSGSDVNGIASGAFALMTPHNRAILFGTNGAERARVANDGMFLPGADNAYDLGSTAKRWRNVYTTDLHLSNEGKPEGNQVDGTTGNWTIQEGEEHVSELVHGVHTWLLEPLGLQFVDVFYS